jgi:hypothetical protein
MSEMYQLEDLMGKTQLKIKIKSLAAEAVIIKKEEQKWLRAPYNNPYDNGAPGTHPLYFDLRHHRLEMVRKECRDSIIAYGYMRGLAYRQIEAKCHQEPNWQNVFTILKRFWRRLDIFSKEKMAEEWNALKAWSKVELQQEAAE